MRLKIVFCFTLLLNLCIGFNLCAQNRPNILFAISDDQSFVHTSYAGSEFIKTPAFDRVAREGIYFSNFYAGSPGCAPSRSSIITGRHHWQNEQAGQHASAWLKKYVPFVDLLEKNGYSVARTGKGVGPFQYAESEADSLWREKDAAGDLHSDFKYTGKEDERFAKGISGTNYFKNFKFFVENVRKDKPFFFWFGGYEPHREYEKDSWKNTSKKLEDVTVPEFLPDNDEIRGDLLDYAIEIEWFDLHLQRMLEYLDEIGELENTIVIVTSDNGMPFPRAKANSYEYGVHVPFAIRYPKQFPGNRVIEDPLGFIDIAPTILEATNTSSKGMLPITGKSLLNLLSSSEGSVTTKGRAAYSGRERHSSSRYLNWGYPQRAIRKGDYLFIWNMKPERWPSGAPQKFSENDSLQLLPLYGLDEHNKYINESAYTDIDDSPTKTYLIENHKEELVLPYFDFAVEKRPEYELYNVEEDPSCLKNLSGIQLLKNIEGALKTELISELNKSNDPRVVGPNTELFDSYKRYSPIRKFPKPEKLK
ncbi:sulfatase family protein [Algoriphagus antarcticus]|uniref:Putative sulfatase n=1 Tax=Algoriphagus antarcticus TaxID=238540 RepID=A0A3E0DUU6_9BACT|nr:sulfatase [Algoriphagus antarcticus]REG87156.1 putative sulfatase [Algoriphagus antarcticus]